MMPGFHFGAVTCYPCRAFFRWPFLESPPVFSNISQPNNPSRRVPDRKTGARCPNFGKCLLNPSAVKHCPGCRLQKCLRWGNKTLVWPPRFFFIYLFLLLPVWGWSWARSWTRISEGRGFLTHSSKSELTSRCQRKLQIWVWIQEWSLPPPRLQNWRQGLSFRSSWTEENLKISQSLGLISLSVKHRAPPPEAWQTIRNTKEQKNIEWKSERICWLRGCYLRVTSLEAAKIVPRKIQHGSQHPLSKGWMGSTCILLFSGITQ